MAKGNKLMSASATALEPATLPADVLDADARRPKRGDRSKGSWDVWTQSQDFLFVMYHLRRQNQNW